MKRFFELQDKILSYFESANIDLLKRAYLVATQAHIGQTRATNEPYIIHPLAVADTLLDMRLDDISIASALLHDVVEDSEDYTVERIEKMFGTEIAKIVEGVTKISKISTVDADIAKAKTIKKMILAMTDDIRVILIKLADRLHNIKTLGALRADKKQRIALETLEIYAPIAYRLGMGNIKYQLENYAFPHAYPKEYKSIREAIGGKTDWAKKELKKMRDELQAILDKHSIEGRIVYRIKREISIYRKLKKQDIELNRVYDLLALRVITKSVDHCYLIMGEIHRKWKPIPSRYHDFISHPKGNGYQSIHTTIIPEENLKFEIQIRTEEMHKVAEQGIAAHWKYKEGVSFLENDERLQWFRDLINIHRNNRNPLDFIKLVKDDLTPNEIYVFTPKGKVLNLSAGATAIDFAYAVHTEVGEHCAGAIVNEKLVPIRQKLNSGDIVEIITKKNAKPSADWLKSVVTNRAIKKISSYIQKRENEIAESKGKRLWAKTLREIKKKYKVSYSENELKERIKSLHYQDFELFFRDLGTGKKNLDKKVLRILFPEFVVDEIKIKKKEIKKGGSIYKLINIEGYSDIDFSFAKCCNPIKGERIIGYITMNRGISVHREDCSNVKKFVDSKLIDVSWNDVSDYLYLVRYDFIVSDKPGMLNAISKVTTEFNSNIRKIINEKYNQNSSRISLSFEVKNIEQLKSILNEFKKIKGIYRIIKKRK